MSKKEQSVSGTRNVFVDTLSGQHHRIKGGHYVDELNFVTKNSGEFGLADGHNEVTLNILIT